jgi:hypothetical protein
MRRFVCLRHCIARGKRYRMRNIALAIALAAGFAGAAHAQDLAVTAIKAPQSACVLGGNENVTIHIFNYGPTLTAGTLFNVAYTVNGGAPVVELLTLASNLGSNSTLDYTFTTQANLMVPGTYTFNATASLTGDVSPSNDTYTGYVVTKSAATVGGSVSGPAGPVLAGSVTLVGYVGDILEWQQSEDGGRRWRRLANTAATLGFDALRHDTQFRARVRSGACQVQLSSMASVSSSDPIFYSGFEP